MTPDNELMKPEELQDHVEYIRDERRRIQLRIDSVQSTSMELMKLGFGGSREISLCITKLQEAKMWLGQELGRVGETDLNAQRDAK